MKIGFIGTGVMGGAMALNLIKKGYSLNVFNRTKSKAQTLLDNGAIWKDSVKDVANSSDVIISIVSFPKDVEQIYFGPEGILENAQRGSIAIDMATSDPELDKKIYEQGKKSGIAALDAPVSGGDVGAQKGTLCIMVGGDEKVYEEVLPILKAMGSTIVYQGGAGAGQQCKMANQIALAATAMGVVEAFAFADKAGLDREKVFKILSSGGADSWQLEAYAPRIFKKDFGPGFYIKLLVKDLSIAKSEAKLMGLNLQALNLSDSLYQGLIDEGMGDLGMQALIKLFEKD